MRLFTVLVLVNVVTSVGETRHEWDLPLFCPLSVPSAPLRKLPQKELVQRKNRYDRQKLTTIGSSFNSQTTHPRRAKATAAKGKSVAMLLGGPWTGQK